MIELLRKFIHSDTGEILTLMGWAAIALFLFWLHPVFLFPVGMIVRELDKHRWNPFDMEWQSWKECLIPSAVYVPIHLAMFG